MIYDYPLTIAANTTKDAPTELEMDVGVGVVNQVDVQFPPGCAGLARCSIWDGGHQLWPSNPDGYFAADAYVISFAEDYPILEAPFVLTLKAWNLDDSYPHTITIRLGVTPPTIQVPYPMTEGGAGYPGWLVG